MSPRRTPEPHPAPGNRIAGLRKSSEKPCASTRQNPVHFFSAGSDPESACGQGEIAGHGGCSSAGRAPGCGPGCRGFESRHSPHHRRLLTCGNASQEPSAVPADRIAASRTTRRRQAGAPTAARSVPSPHERAQPSACRGTHRRNHRNCHRHEHGPGSPPRPPTRPTARPTAQPPAQPTTRPKHPHHGPDAPGEAASGRIACRRPVRRAASASRAFGVTPALARSRITAPPPRKQQCPWRLTAGPATAARVRARGNPRAPWDAGRTNVISRAQNLAEVVLRKALTIDVSEPTFS